MKKKKELETKITNFEELLKQAKEEDCPIEDVIHLNEEGTAYLEIRPSGFVDWKRVTYYEGGKIKDAFSVNKTLEEIRSEARKIFGDE